MFKLAGAPGLEQGVISAGGKPLVIETCCRGGKGRAAHAGGVQTAGQRAEKGFHYRNGQTSGFLAKAAHGSTLYPTWNT